MASYPAPHNPSNIFNESNYYINEEPTTSSGGGGGVGPPGIQGNTGPTGSIGPTGLGITGSTGPTGITGNNGSTGATGLPAFTGTVYNLSSEASTDVAGSNVLSRYSSTNSNPITETVNLVNSNTLYFWKQFTSEAGSPSDKLFRYGTYLFNLYFNSAYASTFTFHTFVYIYRKNLINGIGSSYTNYSLTDTSKNWDTNELVGYTVTTSSGKTLLITGNNSNTITGSSFVGGLPANGESYTINTNLEQVLYQSADCNNTVTNVKIQIDSTIFKLMDLDDRIAIKIYVSSSLSNTNVVMKYGNVNFENTFSTPFIPIGLKGIQGNTGPTGLAGSIGPTGSQGIQGVTGSRGITGSIGSTGTTGRTGATGSIGSTGATGSIGHTGIQGSTGLAGLNGDTLGLTLWLTSVVSDLGGEALSLHPGLDDETQTTIQCPVANTWYLYDNYTTEIGVPNSLIFRSGKWTFETYCYISAHTGYIKQEVYIMRFNMGVYTEELQFTAISPPITETGTFMATTNYIVNNEVTMFLLDRIRIKYYVSNSNSNESVSIIHSGNNSASNVRTTFTPLTVQGATGYTGLQGPTGLSGSIGPTGYTGPQGNTVILIPPTGPTGVTGPAGITGTAGIDGPTGQQGLIGHTGYTGVTGMQGIIGHTGYTGLGATGVTGITGANGSIGPTGFTGMPGRDGTASTSIVERLVIAAPLQATNSWTLACGTTSDLCFLTWRIVENVQTSLTPNFRPKISSPNFKELYHTIAADDLLADHYCGFQNRNTYKLKVTINGIIGCLINAGVSNGSNFSRIWIAILRGISATEAYNDTVKRITDCNTAFQQSSQFRFNFTSTYTHPTHQLQNYPAPEIDCPFISQQNNVNPSHQVSTEFILNPYEIFTIRYWCDAESSNKSNIYSVTNFTNWQFQTGKINYLTIITENCNDQV